MYYNNYYQPFSNGTNPYSNYAPFNRSALIRVTGLDGAKAYQMGANEIAPLFDADNDVFYLKQTDGAGFATYRAFQFTEVPLESGTGKSETDKSTLDIQSLSEKLDIIISKLDANNAE